MGTVSIVRNTTPTSPPDVTEVTPRTLVDNISAAQMEHVAYNEEEEFEEEDSGEGGLYIRPGRPSKELES